MRGQQISLRFAADAANTDIKVVSGSTERVLTIGTSWTSSSNYTASDTIMTIYGDFTKLDCSNNSNKITRVDAYSHGKLKELLCQENTALSYIQCTLNQLTNLKVNGCAALRTLYSSYNNLISLDVTTNTALESLTCSNNNITSLDVSKNVSLERLYCHQNKPTSLDVSKNTLLTLLQCYKNQLTSLRLGNNALLKKLDCSNNKLGALDISKCSAITTLDIYNNSFSTVALDDIYCLLPTRTVADNARITPAYDSSSANNPIVMATNRQNAVSKNWKVLNYDEDEFSTSGGYVCGTVAPPTIVTLEATNVRYTTATLSGVVDPGLNTIAEKGFEWKLTSGGTYVDLVSTDADNTFRANLTGLTDNTGYTYRAYVKVGSTKVYGAEKTFTAEVIPVPTSVTTLNATSIGQTSATLNGSVVVGTYEAVSERGFEWKLTSGGTYADVVYTGTDDTFSVNLTGLADNKGYTFRAYVKVGENKIYGEEKTFTTIATGIENATQAVAIYPNPASNEANISVDGLNSDAIATIYDMQGKVVGTYTIPAATGRAVVDVSAFANGTYIVRIVSQEINRVERMIIKR